MEHLTQVGVGGIFVLLLLQVLMPYIVKIAKNGGGSKSGAPAKLEACETAEQRLEALQNQMATLASSTQQMAVILTQTDPDGAPLVYGSPGRLTAAITSLGNTIDKLALKIDHMQS